MQEYPRGTPRHPCCKSDDHDAAIEREEIMRLILATLVGVSVGATVVLAQNLDAIKQRRDTMKTIAKASGVNFKMMKGETPLDLAKVKSGRQTMQDEFRNIKH